MKVASALPDLNRNDSPETRGFRRESTDTSQDFNPWICTHNCQRIMLTADSDSHYFASCNNQQEGLCNDRGDHRVATAIRPARGESKSIGFETTWIAT